MTYISGSFKSPLLLPNGKQASTVQEVDAYLKAENLAFASDYSKEYVLARKNEKLLKQKQELFDEFLTNYKRMIFL